MYQDSLGTGSKIEKPDSGNEAKEELEADVDYLWELDLIVIGQNNLATFNEVLWYLNENAELPYLSTCAFDSICTDTCTKTIFSDDYEIKGINAIWSTIGEISSLWEPIKSPFLSEDQIYNVEGAYFKVPAHRKPQKPILFGRFEIEPKAIEPPETKEESLCFYKPNSKIVCMMKTMGYNFKKKLDLKFWKGGYISTSSHYPERKGHRLLWQNREGVRISLRSSRIRVLL